MYILVEGRQVKKKIKQINSKSRGDECWETKLGKALEGKEAL